MRSVWNWFGPVLATRATGCAWYLDADPAGGPAAPAADATAIIAGMMHESLQIERAAAWWELTLNRPASRNALSRDLIAALSEALAAAAAEPAVRCLILTGAGPAFCAGLDLREVAAATPEQAARDADALAALFESFDLFPKPIIAAVNGPAVAGGAGIVSVCDLVLAAEGAVIGYPEIRRGLVAALVMCYLRRVVGERRAKFLLLTGENLSAARAVEFGLATEAVPAGELLARARHYAEMFAGFAAAPLAATKRLWNAIRPLGHGEAIAQARALNAAMRTSPEGRAGAEKFLGR